MAELSPQPAVATALRHSGKLPVLMLVRGATVAFRYAALPAPDAPAIPL
jgi:hypothetical protein